MRERGNGHAVGPQVPELDYEVRAARADADAGALEGVEPVGR